VTATLIDEPSAPAVPPRPQRVSGGGGAVVARVVIGVLLAGYAVVSLYPFLWMLSAAFKTH
jgi:multiple sugar transport system permease protein